MPSPARSADLRLPLLRRFLRNRRASAALEFALVAPVFLALLFAILETGIMFLADQALETATQESARTIMTGQTQNASYTEAQFSSNVVCKEIPALLLNCSGVYIDVESQPSFSNISISDPIDSNGNFQTANLQYNPGGACSIVIVRLYYQWPLFVTRLGWNPSNLAGNKRLLAGTAVFRNEPYAGGACPTS